MQIINIESEKIFNSGPVFKTIGETDHHKTVLICIKNGQVISNHRCHCDEAHIVCLQGKVLIFDGQSPNDLTAGNLVIIKKNIEHKIEAVEDSVLLYIQAPNPKLRK